MTEISYGVLSSSSYKFDIFVSIIMWVLFSKCDVSRVVSSVSKRAMPWDCFSRITIFLQTIFVQSLWYFKSKRRVSSCASSWLTQYIQTGYKKCTSLQESTTCEKKKGKQGHKEILKVFAQRQIHFDQQKCAGINRVSKLKSLQHTMCISYLMLFSRAIRQNLHI